MTPETTGEPSLKPQFFLHLKPVNLSDQHHVKEAKKFVLQIMAFFFQLVSFVDPECAQPIQTRLVEPGLI